MTNYAEILVKNSSSNEYLKQKTPKNRFSILQYVFVILLCVVAFTFAIVSVIKIHTLEVRIENLENALEILLNNQKDSKFSGNQGYKIDNPNEIYPDANGKKNPKDCCIYDYDYDSEYDVYEESEEDFANTEGNDLLENEFITKQFKDGPYGFTLGNVLVEKSQEVGKFENPDDQKGDDDLSIRIPIFGARGRNKRDVVVEDNSEEVNIRRKRHRRDEGPKRHGKRAAIFAVHYSGYTPLDHPHAKPEGHIRHPNYTYVDWKESPWSKRHSHNYFKMNNGILEIMESGLYFLYAQVNFLTPHDSAGFYIMRNDRIILTCVVTSLTHPNHHRPDKSNTCYTAGAEHLDVNDKITVRDFSEHSYSKFEIGKSFFGAIRLNAM